MGGRSDYVCACVCVRACGTEITVLDKQQTQIPIIFPTPIPAPISVTVTARTALRRSITALHVCVHVSCVCARFCACAHVSVSLCNCAHVCERPCVFVSVHDYVCVCGCVCVCMCICVKTSEISKMCY